MAAVDALKGVLDKTSASEGIEIAGIVSRNGIPIVCNVPPGSQVDTFSTLSATIMGAAEVVFTGVGKDKPSVVLISSQSSNMICTPISQKSLLVLMGDKSFEELIRISEDAKKEIKEVLSNEPRT